MGDRLGIHGAVDLFKQSAKPWGPTPHHLNTIILDKQFGVVKKKFAPGEARTHGLQIMRLTRCLLRYGGKTRIGQCYQIAQKTFLSDVGFEPTPS